MPRQSKASRCTVSFEPDLYKALRLKSATSGRTMSAIVSDALRAALDVDARGRGDAIRAKLAARGIRQSDVDEAVRWARGRK